MSQMMWILQIYHHTKKHFYPSVMDSDSLIGKEILKILAFAPVPLFPNEKKKSARFWDHALLFFILEVELRTFLFFIGSYYVTQPSLKLTILRPPECWEDSAPLPSLSSFVFTVVCSLLTFMRMSYFIFFLSFSSLEKGHILRGEDWDFSNRFKVCKIRYPELNSNLGSFISQPCEPVQVLVFWVSVSLFIK